MRNKKVLLSTLIGLAVFGVNLARGGALPELPAVKTETPPVIDGKLDDACWKNAAVATGFKWGFESQLHPVQTKVFVTYDDQALYIAFECDEPNPKGMLQAATNAMEIFNSGDDIVDILLVPQKGEFYQIVANAAGLLLTQYADDGRQTELKGYGKYGQTIRTASSVGQDKWFCEFALPFNELRIRPQVGGIWRINFARYRSQSVKPDCASSWSPDMGVWKDRSCYGFLKGITFDTAPRAGSPAVSLLNAALESVKSGAVSVSLTLKAKTAGAVRVTAESLSPGGDKKVESTELVLKEGLNECRVPGYITPGAGEHAVTLSVAQGGQEILRSPPLYVVLSKLMDVYNDRNYYTTETNAFLNINFDAGIKDDLGEMALDINVRTANADKKVVFTKRATGLVPNTRLPLALSNLPVGEYFADLVLVRGTQTVEKAALPLEKLPPAKNEVKVDRERQIFLVNGAPFYSRSSEVSASMFRPEAYGAIVDELAADGINHIILFAPLMGVTNTIAFLDEAQKRNVKITVLWEILQKDLGVFIGFGYHSQSYLKDTGKTKQDQFELLLPEVDRQIDKIKDHPALFGYHLLDEPVDTRENRKAEGRIMTMIRGHDKYHPCWSSYCRIVRIMPENTDTQLIDGKTPYYDFVGVHLFWVPGLNPDNINIMDWWSRMARDVRLKLHRPVHQQMSAAMASSGLRERTPSEHRTQAYMWVMQGNLAGIGYVVYKPNTYSMTVHPKVRAEYRQLLKEFKVLAPILATPELSVNMVKGDASPIRLIARESDGKLYLVTANFSANSRAVTYAGDFLTDKSSVKNLFSGESLPVSGRSFKDRIGYQDSRVYEITGWNKAATLEIRLADTALPEQKPEGQKFFAENGSGAYYLKGPDAIMIYGPTNTLASVAAALNDPAIFRYDPATRTATCRASGIRIDYGGELILGDKRDASKVETLRMDTGHRDNSLYCDGFLKVYNSTIDLAAGIVDPFDLGQTVFENATLLNVNPYVQTMLALGNKKPDANGKITTQGTGRALVAEEPSYREMARQMADFSAFGYNDR